MKGLLMTVSTNQVTKTLLQLSGSGNTSSKAEIAVYEATKYMMDQWNLTGSALARALRLKVSTVNNWLRNKRIPLGGDQLSNDAESVIHLLAIHRSLEAMLEVPEAQQEWLKKNNSDLGATPMEKISSSFQGLLLVRQYLDFYRGLGA